MTADRQRLLDEVALWLPNDPYHVISFDCDATLSALEGINVLAKQNGVGKEVAEMTRRAMQDTGICPSLYSKRLDLVRPTQSQMLAMGDLYYQHRTPHACRVVEMLQSLNKRVYVLSAGLLPKVRSFSKKLLIPKERVFAVDCYFHDNGEYKHYEEDALLTKMDGKAILLKELSEPHERVMHVGDGMNDVAVSGVIDHFVGFGGGEYHEKIAKFSDTYIIENSLAPLLPLILTSEEVMSLNDEQYALFKEGCDAILKNRVVR